MNNRLPEYLRSAWENYEDPRERPSYCDKQARKTPSIPWHNGFPCISCGHVTGQRIWRACAAWMDAMSLREAIAYLADRYEEQSARFPSLRHVSQSTYIQRNVAAAMVAGKGSSRANH